jgi:hypothetical protein
MMNDQRHASPPPPSALRERVLHSLRGERLIVSPVVRIRRAALAAAAAAVLLATGFALGRVEHTSVTAGSRFVLLLYEDSTFSYPGTEAQAVGEYAAWARDLASRGRLELGEKLRDESAVLPEAVPESGRRVMGFFIVRAATMAEARAIAGECPHLRYGGSVAVREIES